MKRFNMWRLVFIIDAALSAIAINVGEFVDCKGMFFVKSSSVELSYCGGGLFGGIIFNKGKSVVVSAMS